MANCSEFPGGKPEISLMTLNEEVIRVGCNIAVPDLNILPGRNPGTSETSVQLTQHAPNVHTLSSQAFETVPLTSGCINVANSCDYIMASRTGSSDPNIAAQLDRSQKNALVRAVGQSHDFGKENSTSCNEAVDTKKTGYCQAVCNGSFEYSECKSTKNTTNSADTVDENTVLRAGRSNVDLTLSGSSSNTCLNKTAEITLVSAGSRSSTRGMEELGHARGSANTTISELVSASGNKTFNPSELVNQLIEGPCIMLPPNQLPVIPSYPGSHLDNQRQSTCSASSSTSVRGLQSNNTQHVGNLTYAEALTKETHSSSSKTIPIDDIALTRASTTQHAAPENVSQQSSASIDNNNTAKVTTTGGSDPANEEATKPKPKRTPNDFVFGKVIGEGSYSTVYLAKEVSTQREFAIKVCDKKHLIRERKTHFVMREKDVLMKLDHPFFIKLAYTFQDSERLYYCLTYARNGELLGYLHKLSAFDVPCTRFYSAEIVLALEYLHGLGIIHRDLKPENILISEDMHIKITDFGTSKILPSDSDGKGENQGETKRKNSFVGTAEYVSPEVLNNQPANFGSDLWALGCIIYHCLSGSLPFRSGNEYQTFQKIVKAEYEFPEGFHHHAKDLVQKLLVLNPQSRLGMVRPEGMRAIKNHLFYEGINWETLPEDTPPKLMPYLPATANNPEFWGQEQRTGFDDQRLAEIITGQSADGSMSPELEEVPIRGLSHLEDAEKTEKMRKQRLENQFHQFVQDNFIIKQGFVDKRKGLFARKRMLLLTEGPHLYYVDAHNKVLKGEIPWSKYLRPEAKNFKIFFVHTPNRTYYLESRQPDAQDWVKQIKEVWKRYYDNGK